MPHIHEKIDFTVSALIVHKNAVLLRRHDKYKMWYGPGGHIELGEDPNEAIIREAKEEVGLNIKLFSNSFSFSDSAREKELIPPRFLNRHHISDTHEHIDMVYFATADRNDIAQSNKELSEEIRWFTKQELEDEKLEMPERTRRYALEALKELAD
ncbi:MAG: NUDIX domain-containing protein [Candidatus Liptonbacteria bacterium]|nr:NUDIX domain-containing protein [Candidatus Liptonbacteria bacterium]